MSISGCDLHTRYQQIARLDTATGEMVRRQLEHENGEARAFYASLLGPVLVGIEAAGCTQWLERMLAELGHELWVGDPAEIRARAVRRQKTDRRDAEPLLDLLLTNRFPRVWVPSPEERDGRQRLKHRDKLVRMRTWVKNQLHYLAMSQGVCRRRKVWSAKGRRELEGLELGPWASRRRQELLELRDRLQPPDRGTRRSAESRGRAPSGSGSADEAEGSGAGGGAGVCADAGSWGALPAQPAGSELRGTEPARALERRSAAAGDDQQARPLDEALVAGGSGAECGAV